MFFAQITDTLLDVTIPDSNITVVTGYASEQIQNSIAGKDLKYVYQAEQLGTANAVQTAAPNLDSNGITLVLYGDVPLISTKTVLSTLKRFGSLEDGIVLS